MRNQERTQDWRKATAQYLCLAHATSYWNVSSSIVFRLKSRNCLVPNKPNSGEITALANRLHAALTTHIENGFQRQLKTGAVFLDLTAAYDIVWHTGLLYKLSKNMPHWFVRLIELFLRDPRFRVHIWRRHQRLENSGEWASSVVGGGKTGDRLRWSIPL